MFFSSPRRSAAAATILRLGISFSLVYYSRRRRFVSEVVFNTAAARGLEL